MKVGWDLRRLSSNESFWETLSFLPGHVIRQEEEEEETGTKGETRREGGSTEGPSLSASEMGLLVC